MKALPTCEPRCKPNPRTETVAVSETSSKAENWLLALLIVLVPLLGGAVFEAHAVSTQRERLTRELADARAMTRDVVDELVKTKSNLETRETQVEKLLDAATLADQQARELRDAVAVWQGRHENLASAASRKIEELAAQSDEVQRKLEEEQAQRESERARLQESLSVVSNQLAATDTELRDTRDFAREAAQWNEHLERGVFALRSTNQSLSSSLSSVQSDLSSAQSDASSARSEASSAESERDRARRALGHAEGVIGSLKNVVAHQRREEVREHQELVRPPVVQGRPHVVASPPPAAPPHPPPGGPPGGRRPR